MALLSSKSWATTNPVRIERTLADSSYTTWRNLQPVWWGWAQFSGHTSPRNKNPAAKPMREIPHLGHQLTTWRRESCSFACRRLLRTPRRTRRIYIPSPARLCTGPPWNLRTPHLQAPVHFRWDAYLTLSVGVKYSMCDRTCDVVAGSRHWSGSASKMNIV